MGIPKRLKELRRSLGINQTVFGSEIGVKCAVVSCWESGAHSLPDSRFRLICQRWNVNPDWLRDGVGEMFAPVITETDADIARRHIAALVEKLPPELQEEILKMCREILEQAEKTRGSESIAETDVSVES